MKIFSKSSASAALCSSAVAASYFPATVAPHSPSADSPVAIMPSQGLTELVNNLFPAVCKPAVHQVSRMSNYPGFLYPDIKTLCHVISHDIVYIRIEVLTLPRIA
ncbi:hypothetical protein F8M41_018414 [Gigaspora margarita]|uniref:Uncharacterized protein n=1 Tax=Gigaspora margarita TaxID=4874 RepID=A0A8H4ALH8_GIGMA|nr:hypothetical protein F8M41_018414 [Gigaspora margarita]